MYVKFRATYDSNHDTFRVELLLIPVAALSLLVNHEFSVMEVLWAFSIYLEAVAILPQLFMVSKVRNCLVFSCCNNVPHPYI